MTWLTPLFLISGLAIAGPILFHMWQRTPRGRRLFSSTMFLETSPPRITKRSRIENWPLLCLRALALLLIAIGFARPVWRTATQTSNAPSPDKAVAILVDVSASLQRSGFWDSMIDELKGRLQNMPASTHVGLFAFDHHWRRVLSFDEAERLDASVRGQLVFEQLQALKPGWGATRLGDALSQTMQALREFQAARPMGEAAEIWLASDLAMGSDLTELAGIDWPETTRLELITPQVDPGANAGLQWVESKSGTPESELRVRITNAAASKQDRFQIGWDDEAATLDRVEVHVPAGQSRTVVVPSRPEHLSETVPLRLFGDDHEFDNRLWTTVVRRQTLDLLYLGTDAADDPAGMRYFLEQALAGTAEAEVVIRTVQDLDPSAAQQIDHAPALTVWTDTQVEPPGWLRELLDQGGALLAVPRDAREAQLMLSYLGSPDIAVQEADVAEFSLLTEIDFEDPLFALFAQARFADFTGIHFWKHRRVKLPQTSALSVLARFDDGDPFLMEQHLGEGRSWFLTSGWQPADSQLARSSKFAPLLHRFLEQSARITSGASRKSIGAAITWDNLRGSGPVSLHQPDGSTTEIPESSSFETTLPGVYEATREGNSAAWAINVAPEESKTDLLPVESLERLGVVIARTEVEKTLVIPDQQRQLQVAELERQQSGWRWCLLAAGLVLLLETAWSGWKYTPVRDSG